MTDKRVRPKLKVPSKKRPWKMVGVWLEPEDYRKFYEIVMERGTSGSETIRQLIREVYDVQRESKERDT